MLTSGERVPEYPDDAEIGQFVVASRRARWTGRVFAVLAVLMVPWTVYLAISLPSRHVAAHWDLAWSGFDVGLAGSLACTAYLAYRRSRWLAIASSVTASLLVVDAWFDVTTSTDEAFWVALVSAALVELPLAGVCVWLAANGARIAEGTVALKLLGRRTVARAPSPKTPSQSS